MCCTTTWSRRIRLYHQGTGGLPIQISYRQQRLPLVCVEYFPVVTVCVKTPRVIREFIWPGRLDLFLDKVREAWSTYKRTKKLGSTDKLTYERTYKLWKTDKRTHKFGSLYETLYVRFFAPGSYLSLSSKMLGTYVLRLPASMPDVPGFRRGVLWSRNLSRNCTRGNLRSGRTGGDIG